MYVCEKFFSMLDKLMNMLITIMVAGLLLSTFGQVAARIFRLSISWTTELSQYFFLWSTVFAGYAAARRGKMIGVELIQKMMPDLVKRIMKIISWGAAAIFYFLVFYYCGAQLPQLMTQTTPILKWPMGMVYAVMMFGIICMDLYFIYLTIIQLIPEKYTKKVGDKE
ncbi:MAG: TRAP transporter small permease [Lachnospiraceae bacterium]